MKIRTKINTRDMDHNHNEDLRVQPAPPKKSAIKETLVRDSGGLKVKTQLRAGIWWLKD